MGLLDLSNSHLSVSRNVAICTHTQTLTHWGCVCHLSASCVGCHQTCAHTLRSACRSVCPTSAFHTRRHSQTRTLFTLSNCTLCTIRVWSGMNTPPHKHTRPLFVATVACRWKQCRFVRNGQEPTYPILSCPSL